jgi:hypothetical protein
MYQPREKATFTYKYTLFFCHNVTVVSHFKKPGALKSLDPITPDLNTCGTTTG